MKRVSEVWLWLWRWVLHAKGVDVGVRDEL